MNWNDTVMIVSRYYHDIFLKSLPKIAGEFSQDTLCLGRNSNRIPPDYESSASLLDQSRRQYPSPSVDDKLSE
jgi:hypothetical protein